MQIYCRLIERNNMRNLTEAINELLLEHRPIIDADVQVVQEATPQPAKSNFLTPKFRYKALVTIKRE
jgi:hypothetical protein